MMHDYTRVLLPLLPARQRFPLPLAQQTLLQVCLDIKRKLATRITLNAEHLLAHLCIHIWRAHHIVHA